MMRPQFGVYRAEKYNFKMSEPDEFDEDDTFRYNNRLAAPAGYHHNALSQYHLGVKLIAAPVFGPIKATSSKRSTLLDHSGSDAGQALQQHLAALVQ